MKKKHLSRRIVLSALVAQELGGDKFLDPDGMEEISEELILPAREMLDGIKKEKTDIDNIISSCLHTRKILELGSVEKSVLRLATYELFFQQDSPPKVILSESVVLTKKFAGEKAAKFVNGVLRGLYDASKAVDKDLD
ncbi:MAG: N utilization substance protein B [candidate division WS2 bacterium]|nr:N utilization substance protein B [Candidatus Lithacetigena glycinireducens]MBT9174786.1 N utilization substance protein B [Candidatus Lithacetigena glycinireducens]